MCTTVERWPKTVHTIASGQFCTERRKQQARWVACGSNTPPLLPLKRQPGVVVMHLHDRLRVRARVDCTAPTQRAIIHANLRFVHCYFEAVFRNLKARPTPPPVSPAWKVGHCFESAGEPAAKSLTRASVRYASCFAEDSRRSFRATIFEALTDPFARKKTNKVKFHTDFGACIFKSWSMQKSKANTSQAPSHAQGTQLALAWRVIMQRLSHTLLAMYVN